MAKVCVFLADGFEEIEGLTVVDLLRRADQDVIMTAVGDKLEVCGSHNIEVKADACISDLDFNDVDLLVLPGGMPGTVHLGECRQLNLLLKEFASKGKRIAAICAAPSVLGGLGLLQGKRSVCYPGYEEELKGAIVTEKRVEVDGTITTSRGVGTAISFGLELISQLTDRATADRIKSSIIYGH